MNDPTAAQSVPPLPVAPRPSKKNHWRLLSIGLGVTALLGASLTWWLYAGKSSDEWRRDARYLPDGCNVIVSVKVEEFLNSGAGKAAIEEITQIGQEANDTFERVGAEVSGKGPPPAKPKLSAQEALARDVRREIGLDPSDILHLTIAGSEKDGQPVLVIRTRKTVKPEDIVEQLPKTVFQFIGNAPPPPNTPRTTKVGTHTIHETARTSFVIPEDRVVLYGTTEALKAILERNGAARLSAELTEALAGADFSKTIAVAAIPPPAKKEGKQASLDWLGSAVVPASVVLTVELTDRVKINFQAGFRDAAQATEFKSALDRVSSTIRDARGAPPSVAKFVESIHAKVSGKEVRLTATTDAAAVIAVISQLGTNTERTFDKVGNTIEGVPGKDEFKYVGDPKAAQGDEQPKTLQKVGTSIQTPPQPPKP